ncbi:MAG TPA: CBS domain-containing protein, partial [bacterium]|nr:CBS domain-containing protein [bacterium]
MEPRFLYFADLLGRVVEKDGARIGRVRDLVVVAGEPYPRVDLVRVAAGSHELIEVPANYVAAWEPRLALGSDAALRPASETGSDRIRLREEILDRQIVDVEGAKVVRVNDLQFLVVDKQLRLAHVDVGTRGLVRRMGWERPLDALVRLLRPGAKWLTFETLLPWKLVQPLGLAAGKIRIEVAQRLLATMHPADLADVLEDLDRERRNELLGRMDVETAAETLEATSPEIATELLEEISPEKAADIVEEMRPDDAADVLGELPEETRQDVLEAMEAPEARAVAELLEHAPKSAGGAMTPEILRLPPNATAADAIAAVRWLAHEAGYLHEVFVVEGEKLVGTASLQAIVAASPETPLRTIATEPPATVTADASMQDVAEAASKYRLSAVPVVDTEGRLEGAVT